MDEIFALIEAGREKTLRKKKEQERQEEERLAAIHLAWALVDAEIFPKLPEAIRAYLVPSSKRLQDHAPSPNLHLWDGLIDIQDLVRMMVKMEKIEGEWQVREYTLPRLDQGNWDGEPYLTYMHAFEDYPPEDFDQALADAAERYHQYEKDHQTWEHNQQIRKEPDYVPDEQTVEEDLAAKIRELIQREVQRALAS